MTRTGSRASRLHTKQGLRYLDVTNAKKIVEDDEDDEDLDDEDDEDENGTL